LERIISKNSFYYGEKEGEPCVVFLTGGKYKYEVFVDIESWNSYLHKYHWTISKNGNYLKVKTSINKHSHSLYKLILENEYEELDYWGLTVDHKNRDPLDNRKSNFRIGNSKLNVMNISSKYAADDMHLIYEQGQKVNGVKKVYGYKVHTNVYDETKYKHFKTIEEAKAYRDNELIPYIREMYAELIKKSRDVEFERGLRDKLKNGEINEVLAVLKKYGIID